MFDTETRRITLDDLHQLVKYTVPLAVGKLTSRHLHLDKHIST